MTPQSPPPLHLNNHNYLTSTIIQHLLINISQSIDTTNDLNQVDYDNTNDSLVRYKNLYRNYHGITSSFVCIFGLTCNLFNIIVLTRPLMRSSTNTILTSLALSDLIKMSFVLPAAILFYCLQTSDRKSEPDFASQFQVTFYMIQMLVALTLHCISTWLTVLLAGFRYVFLSCKTLSAYVSTPDRALIGVSIVVIASTILCIPSYIEHRIVVVLMNDTYSIPDTLTSYRFEQTKLSKYLSLRETVFILHSVIFKLIPCILLLVFSFLLVQQLRSALAKSEKVRKHSIASSGLMNNGRMRGRRREQENRRTTLMLVIVCVLFLITELPQGAILLLTFISKTHSKYYFQIYQQLGDTFDILALINNSVNFILYCLMSRAFRDTFKQTFCFICHKPERRESTISFGQLSTTNRRLTTHLNASINYDNVSTYSDLQRLSNESNNKKKPSKSLEVSNYNMTVSLLNNEHKSNGSMKKNSNAS